MTVARVVEIVSPQIGLQRVSVTDGSDYAASLLQAINATGRDLAARADWPKLMRTVSLASGDTLPLNFARLASGSPVWSGAIPLRRCESMSLWDFLQAFPPGHPYFTIVHGGVLRHTAGGSVRVSYASTSWVNGNTDRAAADGDSFAFPPELVASGTLWRWLRQKGLPYDDQMAEHEAQLARAAADLRGASDAMAVAS